MIKSNKVNLFIQKIVLVSILFLGNLFCFTAYAQFSTKFDEKEDSMRYDTFEVRDPYKPKKEKSTEIQPDQINKLQEELKAKPDALTPGDVYVGYAMDKLYYQNQEIISALQGVSEEIKNNNPQAQNKEIIQLLTEIRDTLKTAYPAKEENLEIVDQGQPVVDKDKN